MKHLKHALERLLAISLLSALLAMLAVGPAPAYAATVTSKVTVQLSANQSSAFDLVTGKAELLKTFEKSVATGTGADQCDVLWSDTRTLGASATEDLDFAGGGLVDALGAAVAPAKIKIVLVFAASGNTNNVVVGGDANSVPFLSAAATTVAIQPGGAFAFVNQRTGVTVTAGTGDIIQVANSGAGTSVTYDIIVLGTSV